VTPLPQVYSARLFLVTFVFIVICASLAAKPAVIVDSEELVARFFVWAEKAKEPLRSYATGLLAVAMEHTEVATDTGNRKRID
jgi:hypothetical protein